MEWYHVWWPWLTSKRVARFVSDNWVYCMKIVWAELRNPANKQTSTDENITSLPTSLPLKHNWIGCNDNVGLYITLMPDGAVSPDYGGQRKPWENHFSLGCKIHYASVSIQNSAGVRHFISLTLPTWQSVCDARSLWGPATGRPRYVRIRSPTNASMSL